MTPFVLMLCLVIALSLLSALIPMGAPASKMVGSAFNPATTAVAIKARVTQPIVATRPALPPSFEPPVAALALASLCLFLLFRMSVAGGVPFLRPAPDRRPFLLRSHRHARAPPVPSC